MPGRHCSTPASSAAWPTSSSRSASARDLADRERVRRVGDEAAERDADVDREDVAVRERVRAGDAVDDHVVRRSADRGGVAAVALEGRRAALRADELLGDRVELGRRHARPDALADAARASRRRSGRRAPSGRSRPATCGRSRRHRLLERLLGSRPRPRRSSLPPWMPTSLPVGQVVVGERRGLARGRSRAGGRSPRACRRPGPPRPRGPSSRSMQTLVGDLELEDGGRAAGRARRAACRAPRPARCCAGSRRARSPSRASGSASRSRISPIVSSSGTSVAGRRGSARPAGRAASRARSQRGTCRPWTTWGMPYSAAIRFACVPLPDPCGPNSRTFSCAGTTSVQEALVGAHHHLRLHLAHRVEGDADHDQERRAAEEASATSSRGRSSRRASVGKTAMKARKNDAGQRQPRQHAVEVLRRRRAGPDAGDVAAVLAQVVGLVDRVELDRRVEVREDDDQERLREEVVGLVRLEVAVDPALRLREELRDRRREREQRGGEDDRDDAGHVHAERHVRRAAAASSGDRPCVARTAPGSGAGPPGRRRPRRRPRRTRIG